MRKLNFSINLKVAGLDFQAQKLPLPNKASFILVTVWWPAVISGPGSILYILLCKNQDMSFVSNIDTIIVSCLLLTFYIQPLVGGSGLVLFHLWWRETVKTWKHLIFCARLQHETRRSMHRTKRPFYFKGVLGISKFSRKICIEILVLRGFQKKRGTLEGVSCFYGKNGHFLLFGWK